jgi:hypothetical protein
LPMSFSPNCTMNLSIYLSLIGYRGLNQSDIHRLLEV